MTARNVSDKTEIAAITADPGVCEAIAEEVAMNNPGGHSLPLTKEKGACPWHWTLGDRKRK